MTYKDFRGFLTELESHGELVRVKKGVSCLSEIGAISRILIEREGPAALFEKVSGCDVPVAVNLLATRKRVALALNCSEKELLDVWLRRSQKRIPPQYVDRSLYSLEFKVPDLTQFPPPIIWNAGDGGPYITFGLFICRDPDMGINNLAIYRLQIKSAGKTGVEIVAPQHGGICHQKVEKRNQPLEVAVAIGCHPLLYLAAQAPLPFEEDEYALAGGLLGEPVKVVKGHTVDLPIPADAEIVLEGRILPHIREPEGPFGEFTGYYSGVALRPVVEFSCVYHKPNPIYLSTYEGVPGKGTSAVMQAVAREPLWFSQVQSLSCPTVQDICFTPGGCSGLHVVVSIVKQAEGQAKNVIMDLLRSHLIKHVVVVDEDINPRDPLEVEWAIATRVQADRDVVIVPDAAGMALDPSQPAYPTGLGAKMGIDATRPLGRVFPEKVELSATQRAEINDRWQVYGLSP